MVFTEKILKASNVKVVHPIFEQISCELSNINALRYIKIYNGRILASNVLSENGKKEPIVSIGAPNIIGVELLIDIPNNVIQFYSITSSLKGCGEQIVSSVVNAAPEEWKIVIVMDWGGGFWQVMMNKYPRLVVLLIVQ